MTSPVVKLWLSLLQSLDEEGNTSDPRATLLKVQRWIYENIGSFDSELRDQFGITRILGLDLARLPIEFSDIDIGEEIDRLRAVIPSRIDMVAMRLRDLFWAGIVVRSQRLCPNCNQTDLMILQDSNGDDHFVYACDRCVWAESEDGKPWHGGTSLWPPQTETLRRKGILPPV
jgi:hypothetical protein